MTNEIKTALLEFEYAINGYDTDNVTDYRNHIRTQFFEHLKFEIENYHRKLRRLSDSIENNLPDIGLSDYTDVYDTIIYDLRELIYLTNYPLDL